MAGLMLLRDTYRDKVHGGWLGKNIGTTLGAPLAGGKDPTAVEFYPQQPGQAEASDLLDSQLVWLHALRDQGIDLTSEDLAREWLEHITYPWDEYGYAAYNLRRGLLPPVTGAFDNWFRNCTAGAGRTEIWAMVAPGAPQVAAELAYRDAVIDHAEEGVWAAMLWAAIESAAFFLGDERRLLEVGLAMVPAGSRVARAVRAAQEAALARASLFEARARVLAEVGRDNPTDGAQNIGFAVLGWLYGAGDFGRSLSAAVGCGYDADYTGSALGALLGICTGRSGLPEHWVKPIGESVVVGWGLSGFDAELTIDELTSHTVEVGEKVVAARCPWLQLVDQLPEPAAPSQPEPIPQEAGPTPDDVPLQPGGSQVAAQAPDPTAPEPPAGSSPEAAASAAPQATSTDGPTPGPEPDAQQAPGSVSPSLEEGAAPDGAESPAAPMAAVAASASPLEPVTPAAPVEPVGAPDGIDWTANDEVKELLVRQPMLATCESGGFEFAIDYGDTGPCILPGVARSLVISVRNRRDEPFTGRVTLSVPPGWQLAVPGAQGQRQMLVPGGMARFGFVLRVPDTVQLKARNPVTVVLAPETGAPTTCDLFLLAGTCWWFVGPFRNMADEGFDRAYEPEDKPSLESAYLARDGGLVRWQKLAFGGTVMPLESEIMTGQPGVAYGVTTLHVPTPTDAKLVAHTNDGVHVWLNGQRVIRRHSHEPFRPTIGYGPASADVTLSAGDNRVMVKVVRCSEPVELAFVAADREGRPLLDIGSTTW